MLQLLSRLWAIAPIRRYVAANAVQALGRASSAYSLVVPGARQHIVDPLLRFTVHRFWRLPIRRDPRVGDAAFAEFRKLVDILLGGGTAKSKGTTVLVDVEDKYVVRSVAEFHGKATSMGFVRQGRFRHEETYLDVGNYLRGQRQGLRIRRVSDEGGRFVEGELKWEGPRGSLQDRPFFEVRTKSPEEFDGLSKMLIEQTGARPHTCFDKWRTMYERRGSTGQTTFIEFDEFPVSGNPRRIGGRAYAQISQEVPPTQREEALRAVEGIAREFGLARDNRDYIEIAAGIARTL